MISIPVGKLENKHEHEKSWLCAHRVRAEHTSQAKLFNSAFDTRAPNSSRKQSTAVTQKQQTYFLGGKTRDASTNDL